MTEQMGKALKYDNASSLSELLTKEKLNACYQVGNSTYTLLALSIKADASDSFAALLEANADREKACKYKTPLMYAAKYGKLDMVKSLVDAGADHAYKNEKDRTALAYAKKYKNKDVFDYLNDLRYRDTTNSVSK